MEIQVRNCIRGWQGFLALCTAAWLLVGCVTPALAGPGDLDMRFGDQGRLVVQGARQAVVQQPDGKLLFVNGESRLQIRRFNADGTPDTQFGRGGVIEVGELGVQARELQTVTAALQPDGKLLIGGSWATAEWGTPLVGVRFIARLDLARDGAPDPTFGKDGVVAEDTTDGYAKLLVLPQGDVIALGVTQSGERTTLSRFDSTGTFLSTTNLEAQDVAPLEDDAVVVLTHLNTLLRLSRAGRESSFGYFGEANLPNDGAQHIAVDGARRIVVCGRAILRYTTGGQLDTAFGPDGSGRVALNQGPDSALGLCQGVAAGPSGNIVAIGNPGFYDYSPGTFVLRLKPDGTAEPRSGALVLSDAVYSRRWTQSLPVWLEFTASGQARMAWRHTGSVTTPATVIEQIDLGAGPATSAVGFQQTESIALESAGSIEVQVIRTGGSGPASVRLEVVSGTAKSQDAGVSSEVLSWAAGDTSSRKLTISINDDTLNEGEERFSVRLYDGVGVAVPAQPLGVTLIDDEALRSLRFEDSSLTWAWGGPQSGNWPTLRVIRSAETQGPVTVHYQFLPDSGSMLDPTCCSGIVRWQPGSLMSEPITLHPMQGLGSFTVNLIDELGRELEATAKVDVVLQPNPAPANPPATPPAGSGGGGAFGLFDLLLISLGWLASRSVRRRSGRQTSLPATGIASLVAACLPLAAHSAPGDLDMRFGDQGRLVLAATTPGAPVAQRSDGKIVLVEGGTNLVVRRFNPDGTPDTQFGQGGRIEVPNKLDITPVAAALQPDGKVLIGGYRVDDFLVTVLFPSFLIRLDGGTYDSTFGNGGAVQTSNDDVFQEILLLPSGDILSARGKYAPYANVIDRIDTTGRILSTVSSTYFFQGLAALDGDSAVVLNPDGMAPQFSLSRLQRSGFDRSFGDTSTGETWVSGLVEHVAVDGLGRIITCSGSEFRRFTANGEYDVTFGPDNSGRAQLESIFGTRMHSCRGLAVDSAGRILAVGSDLTGLGSETRTFVFRLRADGSLDSTIASASGPAILRGRAPPTQDWQPLWLRYAPNGDARIVWRVRSSTPSRERIVVDTIDLGGNSAEPAVGIASYEPRAMERAGFVELPVVRSGSSAAAASVRYEVLSGSADATDVEVTSGTLDWAAGDSSRRTLRINLANDTLNEGEERFAVRLRDGNGVAVPAEPTYITLVDDEALRSLRFSKETITWIQSPSAPSSTWPKLELNRPVDAAGPVTAYYYFSNGWDYYCCTRGVRWEPGQLSPETIFLSQELGLGNSFYAALIDDEWQEVGPSATVFAQLESGPTSNPTTPPSLPPPPPAGSGSGSSSSGGGGALGWFDLLLIGLAAGWILRGELRRAAAAVRGTPPPRSARPSDNIAA